jgi:LAO/AO transport system kinase
MEMADLILVNKADGALEATAARTCADYAGALRLIRPKPGDPPNWPRAATVSAASGKGVADSWSAIERLATDRMASGVLAKRRRAQADSWFLEAVEAGLMSRLVADPGIKARKDELRAAVATGTLAPDVAAEHLLDYFAARPGS